MKVEKTCKWILLFAGVLMCYIFVSCGERKDEDFVMQEIADIRQEMISLDAVGEMCLYSDSVESYFDYYGLDVEKRQEDVEHIFGTFESGGFILAGHIFWPKEYKGTVVLVHGYLNHCGQLKYLIEYLVSEGYAVAAFDLPGHGLSSGDRAAIDDFSQYTKALRDFAGVVKGKVNGPYHVMGFSNGASVVLDYLLYNDKDVFDKVVLAAPLVRCVGWEQMKISYKVYSRFGDSVARLPRKNSSDKEFIKFNRNKDKLHAKEVSLRWVKALDEWNERIAKAKVCEKEILVLQGTNDSTVAWRYNVNFIQNKFGDVKVKLIKKARHELFNESAKLRKEVFSEISSYLQSKNDVSFGDSEWYNVESLQGERNGQVGRKTWIWI